MIDYIWFKERHQTITLQRVYKQTPHFDIEEEIVQELLEAADYLDM